MHMWPLWAADFITCDQVIHVRWRKRKNISLSIVLSQVAVVPGSWYRRVASGFEMICSGTDLRNNFVWTFPIGSELSMLPRTSYSLHASENEVAPMNRFALNGCAGVRYGVYRGLLKGEDHHGWRRGGRELLRVLHCSTLLGKLSTDKCGGKPLRVEQPRTHKIT